MAVSRIIRLATRGSPLALAQAHQVLAACRAALADLAFEVRIIKTTGDKLQRAAMSQAGPLPKGLFTKELETALLHHEADLAVHSLKDLPTDVPAGLKLGAVLEREDARDVLVCRVDNGAQPAAPELVDSEGRAPRGPIRGRKLPPVGASRSSVLRGFIGAGQGRQTKAASPASRGGAPESLAASVGTVPAALSRARPRSAAASPLDVLPLGATVATSSTRRREQLLAWRPDLRIVEIRGNVGTRLKKLADHPDLAATLLAAAGLRRLGYQLLPNGGIEGPPSQPAPPGLVGTLLPVELMIPCVGQAAIGLEIRDGDALLDAVCGALNHAETFACVLAERAFLRRMGGGCQSPVAAYAVMAGGALEIHGVSFRGGPAVRAGLSGPAAEPEALGERLAQAVGSHLNI